MSASAAASTPATNSKTKEQRGQQEQHNSVREGLGSSYVTDTLTLPQTLLRMAIAGVGAALITVIAWRLFHVVQLPSYNSSFVLRALSTAGIAMVVVFVALAMWLWLHPPKDRPMDKWLRILVQIIAYMGPALLVIATLAVPLSATRLYLDGISVDQGFRTQFLTRMTDNLSWQDMAYADMPSFYPGLWFFTGGLFAKLTGLAGWAAFQPWALITLAVTGSALVPVWQRLCGSLAVACALAMTTTAITLHIAPDEPYAAIVAMGMPAAFMMARRAMEGGRAAMAGNIIYLGLSANLYTLFTAISALTVVVMAFVVAFVDKSIKPIYRLAIIGLSSLAIAAIGWGPYLLALLTRPHGPTGTAQHYLPLEGASVPLPMFENLAMFTLGVVALIWMIARFRDPDVHSLTVGLAVAYGWILLSMIATLAGTTMLGFRLGLPIALILGVSGVLALAELRLFGLKNFYPQQLLAKNTKVITGAMALFMAAVCVHFTSTTPIELRDRIDQAYEDTDGDAQRGDRYPADATVFYSLMDQVIQDYTGRAPAETVVLTDEKNFMSYYPYHGYQAMTAHYANPLGEFARRNEAIEEWTKIKDPQELLAAIDQAEADNGWRHPDVMIFRGQLELKPGTEDEELPTVTGTGTEHFTYMIADDIYPNYPNVRFRSVSFNAEAFASGWELRQVGPFVIAMRER
ncbi:Arabinofuranosyltransferase AftA [Corynebacterium urogenitale]|uniref:Galactan 5-O-arabinofuranosyltransferase n=1 Tax=Corynebacterium urogenitale TaxID=2487892 RepID=A0A5J6Z3C2_9CORY|nr:galactan 5-O-arabinofuranosyltransferase [Corynebacterium urogenitale]QFQ01558.1 Arabinofuranosyltransferase AftA [Corynebacterium urogenitale]